MSAQRDDISEWINKALQGDRAAFDQVFAYYREDLRRIVAIRLSKRVTQRIDPSDIVQETQLEAFRRFTKDRAPVSGSLRVWLRGIAIERVLNAHRDHVRALRRSVKREHPLPDESSAALGLQLLAANDPPWSRLTREELADRVRQSLDGLQERDREIIVMRVFEGLSNAESAEVLGLEADTASKRYVRALARLRKLLIADNNDSSLTSFS